MDLGRHGGAVCLSHLKRATMKAMTATEPAGDRPAGDRSADTGPAAARGLVDARSGLCDDACGRDAGRAGRRVGPVTGSFVHPVDREE